MKQLIAVLFVFAGLSACSMFDKKEDPAVPVDPAAYCLEGAAKPASVPCKDGDVVCVKDGKCHSDCSACPK